MDLNMEIIRNIIISIIEICIFLIACSNMFSTNTRIKSGIKYSLSAIIFIALMYVSFSDIDIVKKSIIVMISVIIMMNILFYDNHKKVVLSILSISLVSIAVYVFMFISDYFVLFIIKLFNSGEIYDIIMRDKENIFSIIVISKIIVLFTVILFTRNKKNKLQLTNKQTLMFILLSFFTIIGLISSLIPQEHSAFSPKFIIPIAFIATNLFMYFLLSDLLKLNENLRIKSINEIKSANEIKLWKEISDKNLIQRKMLHDYKETLLCIRVYLENQKIDELKKFVNKLSVNYKLDTSVIKTGNILFDVLINSKYEMAIRNNINMVLKLDNLENINLDDEDFIFLMSNLIDNAIEHNLSLEETKKEIFLTITNLEKYNRLDILIRNPIETDIIVEDNLIKTTKKGDNHGLGLLNIKEIIEKYGGESEIYVDDGYFTYIITV